MNKKREIEKEFGEPFDQVVDGFFCQGHSAGAVARILEVPEKWVRGCGSRQRPSKVGGAVYGHAPTRRRILQAFGVSASLKQLVEGFSELPYDCVRIRIQRGIPVEQALTMPKIRRRDDKN